MTANFETNQPHKLLVVDNEVIVRLSISEEFRHAGFDVVEAGCGAEALYILESGRPIDAIFSDISMPGTVDGLAFAQIVCDRFCRVAVVLTSVDLVAGARAERAKIPFISKPYWSERVVEVITAVLADREPRTAGG